MRFASSEGNDVIRHRMDTYSHLSVLVSIILGLGITNLLSASGGMVRERERVRMVFSLDPRCQGLCRSQK
jgi:hypothetical protein